MKSSHELNHPELYRNPWLVEPWLTILLKKPKPKPKSKKPSRRTDR